MNKLQALMYNNGERLVPYVSHDDAELVRHRSSYAFFHAVISADIQRRLTTGCSSPISIVDLGFGTGYGCSILSGLPACQIWGIDIGRECELFARQYYPRANVKYLIADLAVFIPTMNRYDYVVSRGVMEHVPSGLDLIEKIKFHQRLMIDVPFDEAPGNTHHVLTGITESAFSHMANVELFYEDLDGQIFNYANKPDKANMIMLVLSAPNLPKVEDLLQFPIPPVRDAKLEALSQFQISGAHYYFDKPSELLDAVEKVIKETDVVLDVGCGLAPMNYFRPKLHLMVEPWKEYSDILTYRYSGNKSVIVIRGTAIEALRQLGENSVDSIFLLDVIEHLDKVDGQSVVVESERVAREQIVIFTPLGFMPQHIGTSETDGWGLHGGSMQEHRSGWLPDDFGDKWSFYVCEQFHSVDFRCLPLEKSFGAFYAIRNFERKSPSTPEKMTDFRPRLPSEIQAQDLQTKLQIQIVENEALRREYQASITSTHSLQEQIHARNSSIESLQNHLGEQNSAIGSLQIQLRERDNVIEALELQIRAIQGSRSIRVIRFLQKILGYVGISRYR